ncbi:MAG: hypothetical protein R3D98_00760 [Candidatus Krumholzibacteriia bacterium]
MVRQPRLVPGAHDALAVVKTPLQLLNAIEARHEFGFANPVLYVLTSYYNSREELLALVDERDWAAVRCMDYGHIGKTAGLPVLDAGWVIRSERAMRLRQWLLRDRFDAVFAPWRGVSNLVLGNYLQSQFKHLAWLCRPGRCIVVDDGTDTLRVAAARRNLHRHGPTDVETPARWHQPRRWWSQNRVDWNRSEAPAITVFSTYDVDLPPTDRLVTNAYRHVRARARAAARGERCYFLGQPLVEDGYLDVPTFRELLGQVQRSFAPREVVYLPHPREDRARLGPDLAAVGLTALEIGKPLEFHLLEAAELPAVIASFFCSALDSCRLIWDRRMRLVALRIAPSRLLACHDFVAEIYDYFAHKTAGAIEVREPGEEI